MNVEEQNYHDELLTLYPDDCAASYDRIKTDSPSTSAEVAYHAYWQTANQEESEYAIFSSMYDIVDPAQHNAYEVEFSALGYSLQTKCKRKKTP